MIVMENRVSIEIGSQTTIVAYASVRDNKTVRIEEIEMAPTVGYFNGKLTDADLLSDLLSELVDKVRHNDTNSRYEIQFVLPCRQVIKDVYTVVRRKKVKNIDAKLISDLASLCKKQYRMSEEYDLVDMMPSKIKADGVDCPELYSIDGAQEIELTWTLFLAKKEILDGWAAIFEKLGADSVSFIPAERAYARAFGVLKEAMPELAIVDLGAMSDSVYYFKGGMFNFSEYIFLGADTIENDIAIAYDISFAMARQLKLASGEALLYACKESHVPMPDGINDCKTSDLMTVIQCRMEELYEGVIYQLQQHGCEPGGKAMLVGGGNNLKNSDLLFKRLSAMSVPLLSYVDIQARLDSVLGVKEFAMAIGAAGAECEDGETESKGGLWSIFRR